MMPGNNWAYPILGQAKESVDYYTHGRGPASVFSSSKQISIHMLDC
jgi:hypothetical protein